VENTKRHPWRRPWFQQAEPGAPAEKTSEGRQLGKLSCAVCNLDLPIIAIAGRARVQVTLGLFCETPQPEICPFEYYLAPRTTEERDAALPLDSVRGEVYPS
jgi:hypothetical protein